MPIKSNNLEFTECTLYAIGPDGQYHLLAKPLTTAELNSITISDKEDIILNHIYYANNNHRRMNGRRVYRRRAIIRECNKHKRREKGE